MEKNSKKRGSVYKTNNYVYNLQQYETIRSFARNIFAGKITLGNTDYKGQSGLLNDFADFKKRTQPSDIEKKS